jgi:RNA polymerase sigma-70 factor (ECF subfamily)
MSMSPQLWEGSDESITALLAESGNGNREAEARLIAKVYDELRRIARKLMAGERVGHTLQASALVNEAYLRLFENQQIDWQNRAHFFAVATQQMRRILVDHARNRGAHKRAGALFRVTLTDAVASTEDHSIDILALNDLLDQLEALSPRQARVVELRYFGGLDCEEAARLLSVSTKTVKRDWKMARSWLRIQLAL